jgi:hypothetical protein
MAFFGLTVMLWNVALTPAFYQSLVWNYNKLKDLLNRRGTLHGVRHHDEIVREHVIPFLDNVIQQQANARPHIAHSVSGYLQQHDCTQRQWLSTATRLHIGHRVIDYLQQQYPVL